MGRWVAVGRAVGWVVNYPSRDVRLSRTHRNPDDNHAGTACR